MRNTDSAAARAFRRRIELYLKRTGTTPSRFGHDVLNDRGFVFQLRDGRRVGARVAARVQAWLDRADRPRRKAQSPRAARR